MTKVFEVELTPEQYALALEVRPDFGVIPLTFYEGTANGTEPFAVEYTDSIGCAWVVGFLAGLEAAELVAQAGLKDDLVNLEFDNAVSKDAA